MAFNWPVFWTRAFTALIFVTVMAAGFLYNEWSFFILISIIHFGCWQEYNRLIAKMYHHQPEPVLQLGFMALGYHLVLLFAKDLSLAGFNLAGSFSLPFLIVGMVLIIVGVFRQKTINLKVLLAQGLGLLYISLSLSLFIHLRMSDYPLIKDATELWGQDNRFYFPIIIILAIWINDTMAYLVGSAVGKTPFSKISPKKTLEGTIGGMVLCVLAITLLLKFYFHWHLLLGISLLVAVFGTIGDLVESKIKRSAGVKDSGSIMPGHGGFLDRFDSLLIATPVVYLFILLVYLFNR